MAWVTDDVEITEIDVIRPIEPLLGFKTQRRPCIICEFRKSWNANLSKYSKTILFENRTCNTIQSKESLYLNPLDISVICISDDTFYFTKLTDFRYLTSLPLQIHKGGIRSVCPRKVNLGSILPSFRSPNHMTPTTQCTFITGLLVKW